MQLFSRRSSLVLVLIALASLPLIAVGLQGALKGGNNDVRQWLPEGFRETQQYDWFLEKFGSEEMIVASWPGATLDDPRLDQVAAGLAPYLEVTNEAEPAPAHTRWFRRVMTGPSALQELMQDPVGLAPEAAVERLQGVLVGPDGQTSGLVIAVGKAGAENRKAAVETVYRVAEQAGISRAQLHLGGPTIDSIALDSESQRSRYLLSALAVIFTLLLAWRCLRNLRLTVIVFTVALFCAATSIALVHFTGGTMSLLMMMMPTLVYVLALSACVHLVGYYRDALKEGDADSAPARAVAGAWLPCTLSAVTTFLGLGSLAVSEVVPVKTFGIYSALGVLVSLPVVLLLVPAALRLWPGRPARRPSEEEAVAAVAPQGFFGALSSLVLRYHAAITLGCLALMLVVGAGLARLETSVKLLNLFSPESRIIQDYTWLEEHLGPLVPIELVVKFDETNQQRQIERMQLVAAIKDRIRGIAEVGGTISAATFAPPVPMNRGMDATIQRSMIERHLRKQATEADSHYLRADEDVQLWRISARVEALNAVDYGQFIAQLQEQVEPAVRASGASGVEVTYTGVVPLIYKAQRVLLGDLTESFISAFLLVGGAMVIMLRGLPAGLLSMLPNVFPAVMIFGTMGWMGRLCDIGSMMTASVALGIAVDDTVHFLSWFRRGIAQGLSRREAILLAYRRCARAMLQTTIICGLGLLVFAFSAFVPTARFAYLMFTMLVTALIGDLLFLPALLAGPCGRLFEKARQREAAADALEPVETALAPSPVLT